MEPKAIQGPRSAILMVAAKETRTYRRGMKKDTRSPFFVVTSAFLSLKNERKVDEKSSLEGLVFVHAGTKSTNNENRNSIPWYASELEKWKSPLFLSVCLSEP
jgi:hypothetical protein